MAFQSGTHSKIILTDNCTKIFDAVKDVYKGLNGFPTYFSLQYKNNEFGFGDLDSPIQLAFRTPNILMVKTDSPLNEEVNHTLLATSKVEDKKNQSALVLWFLWIQKTLKIVRQHDLHCNYLFIFVLLILPVLPQAFKIINYKFNIINKININFYFHASLWYLHGLFDLCKTLKSMRIKL